ncbi:hypothetical protein [Parendozoicomonas sp. Alg238-R29]|uniref:hypothetical protein n=1 Tax=Parendozoicomonas sp. Alg238-R29 TaxID=2993446 RepID=UPI00248EBAD7|nr:hypothetical protein [Parendozoicomonas sp. Alg238-R29]
MATTSTAQRDISSQRNTSSQWDTSNSPVDNSGEDIFSTLENRVQQVPVDSLSLRAQQEAIADLQKEQLAWSKSRRRHRKEFDNKTFNLLRWQVGFLSLFVLLQGFGLWGFKLDNWVFGIFVNGSLIYTYAIIKYIASDLFSGHGDVLKSDKARADQE